MFSWRSAHDGEEQALPFQYYPISGNWVPDPTHLQCHNGSTYAFTVDKDKFGARYVITPGGLEIHDRKGYIRTARKVN
jgi:hypothetical protein